MFLPVADKYEIIQAFHDIVFIKIDQCNTKLRV